MAESICCMEKEPKLKRIPKKQALFTWETLMIKVGCDANKVLFLIETEMDDKTNC